MRTTPLRSDSTVMKRCSLTRMPVLHMAWISRLKRSFFFNWAALTSRLYSTSESSRRCSRKVDRCTFTSFTRKSSRLQKRKNWFIATSMLLTLVVLYFSNKHCL